MRVAFFEDRTATDLNPLALMRPVFELVCGRFTQRERILKMLQPPSWSVIMRDYLAETYQEQHRSATVNDLISLRTEPTLLVNGQWLPEPNSFDDMTCDNVGVIDSHVAWLVLDPNEATLLNDDDWQDAIGRIARSRSSIDVGGCFLRYPWDVVNANARQIVSDYRAFSPPRRLSATNKVAVLGDDNNISVGRSTRIDPFVVLDATDGPIWIDDDVHVQSFTRIEGPCCIGRSTQIFRALIRRGTTIGPNCRVGGELEESVLHGCVNKYHEGFLGHSYVCPWVNLGALTTSSDLKSDYSPIRVPLCGEPIDTGIAKVGCFIGDHSKTAIDSMFNTGSSVGVMSMVLPGGELLPKHIPSFARVWNGRLDDRLDLDQSLETARVVVDRRDEELTEATDRLIRYLYHQTSVERTAAVARFSTRRRGSVRRDVPPADSAEL